MSLKKSEIPAAHETVPSAADASSPAAGAGIASVAPVASDFTLAAPSGKPLLSSTLANLLLVVAVGIVVAIAPFVEDRDLIDRYYFRIIILVGLNAILAVGLQLINGFSGQFSLGHAGFMAVGAYLAAFPAREYAHVAATEALIPPLDHPFGALLFYLSLGIAIGIGGGILFLLLQALQQTKRIHAHLPGLLMLAAVGWIVWDIAQGSHNDSACFVWTHLIQFLVHTYNYLGSALAPTAASLSTALPETLRAPLTFIVLVVGGGVFAAAAGLIVGIPTLRLRGDYLAIATLGMAEIIRILIQSSEPLGGALGLTFIPAYTNFTWLYAFVVISVFLVWRLGYSGRGRLIQAVREDEIAASAIGINPMRQKVLALVSGAFLGGLAGALFSLNERSITPGFFGLQKSIEIVVIVTLGGLGSVSGAILAAIVLTILPELLRPIHEYRMIIYSLLLIGMMLIRPQGLLGGFELWPRRRYSRVKPGDTDTVAKASSDDSCADLEAQSVGRRFGGLTALNDFCLKVSPGQLVGLIGPNGAGKTTAFNVITGVYTPSSGQVLLCGKRVDGLSPVWINRHGVARTFQNIRLFKDLTVMDNVAAALHDARGLSLWRTLLRTPGYYRARGAAESQAMGLLKVMRLERLADSPAGSLPYGDQRRLEIARALATGPKVLLLDEPAAGMNPREKVELMELIGFVRDRFGVGILLIEHDMKLVMNICQQITVLDHGETIAVGTPAEIQANERVIEAYLGEPG